VASGKISRSALLAQVCGYLPIPVPIQWHRAGSSSTSLVLRFQSVPESLFGAASLNPAHRGTVMAISEAKKKELKGRRGAPLVTPSDLGAKASVNIAGGMNAILADVWALYFKTKNFHWHMSGPHFRDYHLLLDEQADQLYEMSDPIAERIRKVGGNTLRSIGHVARLQRIKDNDADYVDPLDMLAELREDNQSLAARLREVHDVVDEARDIATASLIENWIDETERRTWFLFEASRQDR